MFLGWVVYTVLQVKTLWLCFWEALLLASQMQYTVKSVHNDDKFLWSYPPLRTKFGFCNFAKVLSTFMHHLKLIALCDSHIAIQLVQTCVSLHCRIITNLASSCILLNRPPPNTPSPPLLPLRWQRQVGVLGGWAVVFPRGLLQDRMSTGSKCTQCQALNSRLSGFRARCWLCLPLQMQHRLLCKRQSQEEDTKVSVWNWWQLSSLSCSLKICTQLRCPSKVKVFVPCSLRHNSEYGMILFFTQRQ